ncbi:MAG: hypothetical protein AMJ42_04560 [Deltaproteobacteria bacterium DG_8]|nr:MAG: hypothetical protein AMJ42_04560 [Deltaproteobacteria bacterium DG_8]
MIEEDRKKYISGEPRNKLSKREQKKVKKLTKKEHKLIDKIGALEQKRTNIRLKRLEIEGWI